MTNRQYEKWSQEILSLLARGIRDVDVLIQKRGNQQMSTFCTLKRLAAQGKVRWVGKLIWLPSELENLPF